MSLTKATYSMIKGAPLNVLDYGATGNGVVDDWPAIQAAIDAGVVLKRAVYLPSPTSKYLISRPLVLDDGQQLIGESREKCVIEKTTTNGPSPALGVVVVTRGGVDYDYDYDENALVILKKPASRAFSNGVGIYNLSFQAASGVIVDYGIYAPLFSRADFNQVSIYSAKTGIFTYNAFMNSFNRVEVWTCEYGFRWANDGSGIGTGTSCVFTDCWVRTATVIAFDFYGLVYSTLTSCAAEDVRNGTAGSRPEAYRLNLCRGVSLVACGCEGVQGFVFRVVSGGVSVLGGNFFGLSGDTFSGDTATVFVDDAKVTIEGGTIFGVTASPGNIYNEIVRGANGLLIYDGTVIRPSGGNTNPLFTGGGEIVVLGDAGQGLSTRTSTGSRNACLKETTVVYGIIDGSVTSTGAAQTIFTVDSGTANAGMYIVNASVAASGSTYRSVAIVVTDGIDANSTTLVNGTNLVISVSGLNVQVAAAAAGVGVVYTIQKIL